MVTANLKYTKKKQQQQPCHEIEVPLKRKKKTHTQKTTKQNKVNEENEKTKQT